MMDANELVNVAYDAMSGIDLTAHDRGQIYGVLQMALRTLEMQYGALLTEADEETAEAKKLWREALAELDALKVDRDAVLAANHALNKELRNRTAERDASGRDYVWLSDSFATMRQERDKLSQQCDLMAAEIDAKQRELDKLQAARDETVAGLQAENARLHRSLAERMSARIHGAV